MRIFIIRIKSILVLGFLLLCWGCVSSENDMETAGDNENTVEIKTSQKETGDEIKSELSRNKEEFSDSGIRDNDKTTDNKTTENKITDNKFSEKQVKSYALQIAAFNDEDNANSFTEKAKQILNMPGIYYKNVNGIFKIRVGNYNSLDEALTMLTKISIEGFTDSFVTDLSSEKK
jgi:septal ring-binding cell division protein DamX